MQNEANLPGGAGRNEAWGTRGERAKRSQFLDCGFRIADWGRTCGETPDLRPAEGKMRKTNPISGRRATPPSHYSIIPPFQSDADGAKRSQFPAPPGGPGPGGRGRGALYKQSQFTDRDGNGRVEQSQFADKNKDGRAKQSQSPAVRSARGIWNPPPYGGATGTIGLQFRVVAGNVAQL